MRIDALSLRTGKHSLEVTVLDEAGNQASQTVTFRVVASYGGGKKLVNRLDDERPRRPEARREAEEGAEGRQARRHGARTRRQALTAAQALRAGSRRASKDKEVKLALKHLSRTLKSQL